ncbi:Ger(x)C family germination protein [Melghiribacillus thermohalophilus]|uniref:Ger(X)C family germination protein n=1 Tax=Melghiribacillus thermohalophilus TaxID=1324956 RepID=A0A4R3MSN2_9BACI|nr:Ger(x)C family spore germination protein [Melghiribacillus thermohalophilus]TCT17248.1 Ger(x)C family germination protein [Melghiribacillus thermohalophilus]
MKKLTVLFILSFLFLNGCGGQLYLEKTTIALMLGIGTGEEERYRVLQTSPVFKEEAEKKTRTFTVEASTLREARKKLDSKTDGNVVFGKMQVVLVTRDLLKNTDIYEQLDTLYRDPKNTVTAYMVCYNGDLSDLVNYNPPDIPRLATHIKRLVSTTRENESTVATTLEIFRRLYLDKVLTPFMAEIQFKDGDLKTMGIALLNKDGRYVLSLNKHESSLILILRDDINYPVPLTLSIESSGEQKPGNISLDVIDLNRKVKTSHQDGSFSFDIQVKMDVNITESHLPFNTYKDKEKTEKLIQQKMEEKLTGVLNKLRENELTPLGFGLQARAQHYKEFKKVEDRWQEVFKEADINIDVEVEVQNNGTLSY